MRSPQLQQSDFIGAGSRNDWRVFPLHGGEGFLLAYSRLEILQLSLQFLQFVLRGRTRGSPTWHGSRVRAIQEIAALRTLSESCSMSTSQQQGFDGPSIACRSRRISLRDSARFWEKRPMAAASLASTISFAVSPGRPPHRILSFLRGGPCFHLAPKVLASYAVNA